MHAEHAGLGRGHDVLSPRLRLPAEGPSVDEQAALCVAQGGAYIILEAHALLLVGVVLMAAVAVKALGPKIGQAATNTEGML